MFSTGINSRCEPSSIVEFMPAGSLSLGSRLHEASLTALGKQSWKMPSCLTNNKRELAWRRYANLKSCLRGTEEEFLSMNFAMNFWQNHSWELDEAVEESSGMVGVRAVGGVV